MKTRDTQLDAWDQLQPKIGEARRLVLKMIALKGAGGATLFELQTVLGWPVNRISGRVTELTKDGMIGDTGLRRVNPASGKRGIAWVAQGTP